MGKMTGKIVLITGGAGGIGFCTAQFFARAGARVIITDINEKALADAERKLGRDSEQITTYCVDVSKREKVNEMAEDVLQRFGQVDVLINNAGVGYTGELADTTYEDWERLVNVNFWGVLNNTYAFLPSMKKRRSGQIVNLSSGQTIYRMPTWGAYTATKMAVTGFSDILHYELKKYNIHVTTIIPFMVNTGLYDNVVTETKGSELSMKLIPYYSHKPETAARKIYNAVLNKKAVDMGSPLNRISHHLQFVPLYSRVQSTMVNFILGKKEGHALH